MTARAAPSTVALAVAGLVLSATWLWFGPPLMSGIAGDGVPGEALFTVLVFAPLLLLTVIGGQLSGIRALSPGAEPLAAAGRGAGIGIAALALAVGYAAVSGTLVRGGGSSAGPALLFGLATILVQVLAEEALFRGWFQPAAARAVGPSVAIALTAAVFAALHLVAGAAGALALLNLFIGGLLFGALAARGGIAGAVAAHGAWNAGEQLLLGLDPNPGLGGFGAVLDLDLAGAAAWGGSADGLNGSWAMTLALLAVTLPRLWRLESESFRLNRFGTRGNALI